MNWLSVKETTERVCCGVVAECVCQLYRAVQAYHVCQRCQLCCRHAAAADSALGAALVSLLAAAVLPVRRLGARVGTVYNILSVHCLI